MRFADTAVLLYAVSTDPAEAPKAAVARELMASPDLALSVQVLQEFYVQATRSTRKDAMSHVDASQLVEAFGRFPVAPITVSLMHAALETRGRFQLSYWDAAVLEAARSLGCRVVLSEDLDHATDFDGVRVENPFAGL